MKHQPIRFYIATGLIVAICFLLFIYFSIDFAFDNGSKKSSVFIDPNKIKQHTVHGYTVVEFRDLLTHEECDHIIQLADNRGYMDSHVYNDNAVKNNQIGELDTEFRLSKTCWIENHEDPLVEKIAKYSSHITNLPIENQEALQVARYTLNGKFNSHYDCCVYEDEEKCRIMNGNSGQRRSTLMVYLNDDFDGGETEFVNIGVKIKPEKGKAILFWSTDDNGKILENSLHRGNKVTRGMKMICTKWSHMYKWENIE